MGFLAIDNEDHTIVFQHMSSLLLMLLSNRFYLIQLMEPIEYHSYSYFLDNKPKKKTYHYLNTMRKEKA